LRTGRKGKARFTVSFLSVGLKGKRLKKKKSQGEDRGGRWEGESALLDKDRALS